MTRIAEDRHSPCFNSIVVRLKETYTIAAMTGAFMFQFHSGSIKRETENGTGKML